MTRLEFLDLYEKRSSRRSSGRKVWPVGCALALSLLILQAGGILVKPQLPKAYGAMWQDFLAKPAGTVARHPVQFGISYQEGEGISFKVSQDTPVRVQVDGGALVTRAAFPRLEDVLQEANVELGERDRAEAKIITGEKSIPEIKVVRVRTRIVTEEEPIPYSVRRVKDPNLAPGETRVRNPGEDGVLLKKTEETMENGVTVSRKELGNEVLRQPIPRVIAYGEQTSPRTASRGDTAGQARQSLEMIATAYTHTGDPTATGVMPYVGGVAVDPKVIPLGTRLYIEGYGPARAVDTGGLIKGNRVDLFFNTEAECYAWGRRPVDVQILES